MKNKVEQGGARWSGFTPCSTAPPPPLLGGGEVGGARKWVWWKVEQN
jgi:hypothetical protein